MPPNGDAQGQWFKKSSLPVTDHNDRGCRGVPIRTGREAERYAREPSGATEQRGGPRCGAEPWSAWPEYREKDSQRQQDAWVEPRHKTRVGDGSKTILQESFFLLPRWTDKIFANGTTFQLFLLCSVVLQHFTPK